MISLIFILKFNNLYTVRVCVRKTIEREANYNQSKYFKT